MTNELPSLDPNYFWWHSIDLGNGIVTPGYKTPALEADEAAAFFDRGDLTGKSVLDIGAWNGFYSFEAKRRGAGRVLATDSFCWTDKRIRGREGFEFARQVLKSDVEHWKLTFRTSTLKPPAASTSFCFLGSFIIGMTLSRL
jgi:tRNA (mo5U34)-methyltransferase